VDHVAHIVVGVSPIVVRSAHVWGSAPLHARISIETLTEIALRLTVNSGSFCSVRFAFGPRDLPAGTHVIAGYNININFGPALVAQRHRLRGLLHPGGDQPFEAGKVASIGRS
jgi:hypothetical protein